MLVYCRVEIVRMASFCWGNDAFGGDVWSPKVGGWRLEEANGEIAGHVSRHETSALSIMNSCRDTAWFPSLKQGHRVCEFKLLYAPSSSTPRPSSTIVTISGRNPRFWRFRFTSCWLNSHPRPLNDSTMVKSQLSWSEARAYCIFIRFWPLPSTASFTCAIVILEGHRWVISPFLLKLGFINPLYHRIGWWENLQENPIFDGKKTWFPVDFPTKPIQWL